jgi:hypothetical protein
LLAAVTTAFYVSMVEFQPQLRALLLAIFAVGVSCRGPIQPPRQNHPYQFLDLLIVHDAEPLKNQRPTLEDLAFTFPVFESGAEETKKGILLGDAHVVETANGWQMERLSEPHASPLIIRLSIGPVFEGVGSKRPLYVYRYERVANGWRRLEHQVIERSS